MRTRTMFAVTAAAALTLSACGGGGGDLLTQEQSADALLTEEEFPLDGFTRGEVEEGSSDDSAESTAGADDLLEGFPGADQLSQECQDALTGIASMETDFSSQSQVEFTGTEGDSLLGAPTVQLVVASMEGDNVLDAIDSLNSECEEVTIEESGMEMTMSFSEVEGDAQGTKIGVDMMGQGIEMIFAGREDGGNYTVVTGMGVTDDEVLQVLDAQDEKIDEL